MIDINKVKIIGNNVLVKIDKSILSNNTKSSGLYLVSLDTRRSILAEVVQSSQDDLLSGTKILIPRFLIGYEKRSTYLTQDDSNRYYLINRVDIDAIVEE